MSTATARAHANIALVKYWGKRDAARNLPAAGSLSLTLGALETVTTVRFDPKLAADELVLNGAAAPGLRVTGFLDLVRAIAGTTTRAAVETVNRFPTASGLASSASGFAALALAATRAAGVTLDARALSRLARQGSGSAARSIFAGFARVVAGDDDAWAEAVDDPRGLAARARMVIAEVGGGAPKLHGSRDAMEHCAATSPLYRGWLECVPRDLAIAEDAIARGDLAALGELAEANALAMHAAAIASRPAIVYWQPATLGLLAAVRALRDGGVPAWATMDAGPHVKVLTDAAAAPRVALAMQEAGASAVTISEAGGPAEVIA